MRVLCAILDNPIALPFLAEACGALSNQVSVGEGALFLEISTQRKFSEKEILRKLSALGVLFETELKFGLAGDPATALAFAATGLKRKKELPLHTMAFFLAPFAPSSITVDDALAFFANHGFVKFKDLVSSLNMPQCLREQILLALERWGSPSRQEWPRFVPLDPLRQEWLAGASSSLLGVERLLARLHGRGRCLTKLKLCFASGRSEELQVSAAQNSALLLLPQLEPHLKAEVSVVLEVAESIPGHDACGAEREIWRSLVSRLHEKMAGRYLALPLRGNSPNAKHEPEQGLLFPFALRPLSILRKPEPLALEERRILRQGKVQHILKIEGPATIHGEWWFEDHERSYYKAELSSGEEWWVYATSNKELFLHGVLL